MKRRLRECVERWPEAMEGEYNPSCCRWPKSCSATIYDENRVTEADLEPEPEALKSPILRFFEMGSRWEVTEWVIAPDVWQDLCDYMIAEHGTELERLRVLSDIFSTDEIIAYRTRCVEHFTKSKIEGPPEGMKILGIPGRVDETFPARTIKGIKG